MIKSPPTDSCAFTFHRIAFVVIFQTKLVSFESEFGSISYKKEEGQPVGHPACQAMRRPTRPGPGANRTGHQPGLAPAHPVVDRPGRHCHPGNFQWAWRDTPAQAPVSYRAARWRPRPDRPLRRLGFKPQRGPPAPRSSCLSAAQRGCCPVRLLGRSDRATDRAPQCPGRSAGLATGWAVF